ncbi:MAG: DoxX family protein [Xanthomonadaceae bacterium]|nr:DoxX family protein [Xanthomonadaceae bacterium]MDE1964713.1 DoxX family protein [Xanthomonadaceae bacterium]
MLARPHTLVSSYRRIGAMLERIDPLVLLLLRFWVALAFWRAGVVKFDDPAGTRYLFESTYHVPLMPPDLAASVATWIELVAPWLLLLGVGGRLTAVFLFVYNAVAVVSYPDLWPHGLWAGLLGDDFNDHKVWAIMLMAVIVRGPGALSVDRLLERLLPGLRRRPS